MIRQLERARRYWRWRFKASGNIPLFWHIGRPNFGDDINPTFMQKLTGRSIRFSANRDEQHFLAAGSILECATTDSIVVGSGYLKPDSGPLPSQTAVLSLRGELSLQRSQAQGEILLGDPLVLLDLLYKAPSKKKYQVGFVPHILNSKQMQAKYGSQTHVICPSQDPWHVIAEIASCERVVSQSLHGLIVADALGIPNLWVAPSNNMLGGRFKFDDYFSTLDMPKEPFDESLEIFQQPEQYPFAVGNYKYSKSDYRSALIAALDSSTTPYKQAS